MSVHGEKAALNSVLPSVRLSAVLLMSLMILTMIFSLLPILFTSVSAVSLGIIPAVRVPTAVSVCFSVRSSVSPALFSLLLLSPVEFPQILSVRLYKTVGRAADKIGSVRFL